MLKKETCRVLGERLIERKRDCDKGKEYSESVDFQDACIAKEFMSGFAAFDAVQNGAALGRER